MCELNYYSTTNGSGENWKFSIHKKETLINVQQQSKGYYV